MIRFLFEAPKAQYIQMFAALTDPEMRKRATEYVEWARKNLKREDRIVWYLRFARIGIILAVTKVNPALEEQYKPLLDRYSRELQQRGISKQNVITSANWSLAPQHRVNLRHNVSMEEFIPELARIIWSDQTLVELMDQYEAVEEEWKRNQKDERYVPPTETTDAYDDPHLLIKFPDGFAWWNLGVTSCSAEGDAMGHCGNTAADREYENVLSLRQRVTRNGKQYDAPHATFILDTRTNLLGEMKGYGNKKPEPKYHPYIVELLKSKYVNGIKGGGYAPDQNFSLLDLSEQQRDELFQIKPELGTMDDIIEQFGVGPELVLYCKKRLLMLGLRPPAISHLAIVQDPTYGDVMLIRKGINVVDNLPQNHPFANIIENYAKNTVQFRMQDIDKGVLTDFFRAADMGTIDAVLAKLGYEPGEMERRVLKTDRAVSAMVDLAIRSSDFREMIEQSFREVLRASFTSAQRQHNRIILKNIVALVNVTMGIGYSQRVGFLRPGTGGVDQFDLYMPIKMMKNMTTIAEDDGDVLGDMIDVTDLFNPNARNRQLQDFSWVSFSQYDMGAILDPAKEMEDRFQPIANWDDLPEFKPTYEEFRYFLDAMKEYEVDGIAPASPEKKAVQITTQDIARAVRALQDIVGASPREENPAIRDLLRRAGIRD